MLYTNKQLSRFVFATGSQNAFPRPIEQVHHAQRTQRRENKWNESTHSAR
jgi:hypothetical protein